MKSWQTAILFLLILGLLFYLSYRHVWKQSAFDSPPTAVASQALVTPQENSLTFCSDFYMPMAGESGSEQEGYAIDLVRNLYEPLGYQVNYLNIPWSRCVSDTRNGLVNAVVGTAGEEAADFVFPNTNIGYAKTVFYVRSEDPWSFGGLASLADRRLGVIRGYDYYDGLDGYIQEYDGTGRVLAVGDGQPLAKLVELLLAGQLNVFVEDPMVLNHYLQQHPDLASSLRLAGEGPAEDVLAYYVAFSPALTNSQSLADLFDLRLRSHRSDGVLQKILDKYGYGPDDWAVKPQPKLEKTVGQLLMKRQGGA